MKNKNQELDCTNCTNRQCKIMGSCKAAYYFTKSNLQNNKKKVYSPNVNLKETPVQAFRA